MPPLTELVRTDSYTLQYFPYKNKVSNGLSPMGRERKIQRLNNSFIGELNLWKENNRIFQYI